MAGVSVLSSRSPIHTSRVLKGFRAVLCGLVLACPARADLLGDLSSLLGKLQASVPGSAVRCTQSAMQTLVHWIGPLGQGNPATPEKTAEAFLSKHADLLGGSAGTLPGDIRVSVAASVGQNPTLMVDRVVDGLEYSRGQIVMQLNAAGKIVGLSGAMAKLPPIDKARVDGSVAARTALDEIRRQAPDAQLGGQGWAQEYLDLEADGQLHQHVAVHIPMGNPPTLWHAVVGGDGRLISCYAGDTADAPDGRVVTDYPAGSTGVKGLEELRHDNPFTIANGTVEILGMYYLQGPHFVAIPPRLFPWETLACWDGHFIFDATPFPYGKNEDPKLEIANPQAWQYANFLEVSMYYQLEQARHSAIQFGAPEVENASVVYEPLEWPWVDRMKNNGFFVPHQNNFLYGNDVNAIVFSLYNDQFGFVAPACDPSAVRHEYGHFVEYSLNRFLDYLPDPTVDKTNWQDTLAVGEGWADFFAASSLDNPKIALMAFAHIPDWIRNCENDYKYPLTDRCPDHEQHCVGQVFAGIMWDIRQLLGAADACSLGTFALRLARQPVNFQSAAAALYLADACLHDGAHLKALQRIFDRHGINIEAPPPPAPESPTAIHGPQ